MTYPPPSDGSWPQGPQQGLPSAWADGAGGVPTAYGHPIAPTAQGYGGAPGGFVPGPPPGKPRTGLIVAIVAAVLVVLAGIGVGVFLLSDSGSSPERSAEPPSMPKAPAPAPPTTPATPRAFGKSKNDLVAKFLGSVNARDWKTAESYFCDSNQNLHIGYTVRDDIPKGVKVKPAGPGETPGDIKFTSSTKYVSYEGSVTPKQQGSKWCVDSVFSSTIGLVDLRKEGPVTKKFVDAINRHDKKAAAKAMCPTSDSYEREDNASTIKQLVGQTPLKMTWDSKHGEITVDSTGGEVSVDVKNGCVDELIGP